MASLFHANPPTPTSKLEQARTGGNVKNQTLKAEEPRKLIPARAKSGYGPLKRGVWPVISDHVQNLLRPESCSAVDEFFRSRLNGALFSDQMEDARDNLQFESHGWEKPDRIDPYLWNRGIHRYLTAVIEAFAAAWQGPDSQLRDFYFWIREQVKGALLRRLEIIVIHPMRGESSVESFEAEAIQLRKRCFLKIAAKIRALPRPESDQPSAKIAEAVSTKDEQAVEKHVTVADAAKMLGVTRRQVQYLANKKRIRKAIRGKYVLRSIEEFLAGRLNQSD